MRSRNWDSIIAGLLFSAPIAQVARAETYLTEAQAMNILFPDVPFTLQTITLSDPQRRLIQQRSGETVRNPRVRLWRGRDGQGVFVDRVIGKHEYITYAVGIDPMGKVQGIEIMDYRESYGGEVRRPAWRRQFKGKAVGDSLKLDRDIQNISGATLSSAHITAGVRRIVHTYAALTPAR